MDTNPAEPDAFAAELDDVNAELDRLSQSIAEPTFTEADAAMGDDLGETISTSSPAPTKPPPSSIWLRPTSTWATMTARATSSTRC
jgi:hypothetical protein